uniref:Uncharacterized protein n=1 Tax=Rhizophora mucronata TaxID=61149 RepID=A0A2P2MKV9_RHIMU
MSKLPKMNCRSVAVRCAKTKLQREGKECWTAHSQSFSVILDSDQSNVVMMTISHSN